MSELGVAGYGCWPPSALGIAEYEQAELGFDPLGRAVVS